MKLKLLILILFGSLLCANTSASTFPKLNGKPIIDAANIIPNDREEKLNARLKELQLKNHHQIAILTTPSLQGRTMLEYSVDAFRFYQPGSKERKDGVLLVVAPKEAKARIAVGDGLEGVLTDAISNQINREVMLPSFTKGDYATAIEAGIEAIAVVIEMEEVSAQQLAETNIRQAEEANSSNTFLYVVLGGSVLLLTLFFLFVYRHEKKHKEETRENKEMRLRSDLQAALHKKSFHDRSSSSTMPYVKLGDEVRKKEAQTYVRPESNPDISNTAIIGSILASTYEAPRESPSTTIDSWFSGDGGDTSGGGAEISWDSSE